MPRRTIDQQAQHEHDVQRAIEILHRIFDQHGAQVATIVDHVNRAGDVRWIRTLVIGDYDTRLEIMDVSHYVATILDVPANTMGHNGVRVEGGGMDMGFDLVYRLSRAMYGSERQGENGGYAIRHNRL